jgi:hypothetical protein
MAYITAAGLLSRLGLSNPSADESDLVDAAVSGACAGIDLWCGRRFDSTDTTETRTFKPYGDSVVVDDIATTTALTVSDNGTSVSLSSLVLDPANGIGVDGRSGWPYWRLTYADGTYWTTDGNKRTVSIVATWGWAATPANVVNAAYILAKDIFQNKDVRGGAAGFGEYGVVRIQSDSQMRELLAPFRRERRKWGMA